MISILGSRFFYAEGFGGDLILGKESRDPNFYWKRDGGNENEGMGEG
jgi:hypothetical protein